MSSPRWEAWLARSGETPPDFDALPDLPDLPDLPEAPDVPDAPHLPGVPGHPAGAGAWPAQRAALLSLFQRWVIGTVPPPPARLEWRVEGEREEPGATVRHVRLGLERGASVRLELLLPRSSRSSRPPDDARSDGDAGAPLPVFMTQHNHRAWALLAVRRGYLGCVYAGADAADDTDSFLAAYPEYDWSRLTRRAWAAARCVDALLEYVPQADAERIVLAGHSRNGKQSLIASALDERFAAVVSSSSGAGGTVPARFGEHHFTEGIELLTRQFPDWFHPRLRFFAGREHKLPVDMHQLVALSAPRACLISTALNDAVESTWAVQQAYLAAQQIYRRLGAPERLTLLWRQGGHETSATVIERYLDWCDAQLRPGATPAALEAGASGADALEPAGATPAALFPERLIHPWSWESWRRRAGDSAPAAEAPDALPLERPAGVASDASDAGASGRPAWLAALRTRVEDMLGEAPPGAANLGASAYGVEAPHVATLLRGQRDGAGGELEKHQVVFGEYLSGDVYTPAGATTGAAAGATTGTNARATASTSTITGAAAGAAGGATAGAAAGAAAGATGAGARLPAILWLHPWSVSNGYVAAYRRGAQPYRALAGAGYATFCFDAIGCGRRIEEVERFYDRHPRWSLLGKMVRDAGAAVDALLRLPYVDAERVWAVGYGTGALVALHLAALDPRLAGLVTVCGPPPFRSDTAASGTGGLRRWSHLYLLLPRLGFFDGRESAVPYDVDDLLAAVAPRPALVVSPQHDREAPLARVTEAVDSARRAYALSGAPELLEQRSPDDYNRFGPETQALVLDWLAHRGVAHNVQQSPSGSPR